MDEENTNKRDMLWKIRPLFEDVILACTTHLEYGIWQFVMADSETGYMWNVFV